MSSEPAENPYQGPQTSLTQLAPHGIRWAPRALLLFGLMLGFCAAISLLLALWLAWHAAGRQAPASLAAGIASLLVAGGAFGVLGGVAVVAHTVLAFFLRRREPFSSRHVGRPACATAVAGLIHQSSAQASNESPTGTMRTS